MAGNYLVTKDFLQIFDAVSSRGERIDGAYEASGIRARHDFDGYTCWLEYKDLTVTLGFHGKLMVEYDKADSWTEFYNQSQQLIGK